jgi:hypothetical protein
MSGYLMIALKTGYVHIVPPEKSDISSIGIESLVLINYSAPGQDTAKQDF